jgi:type II secretory pathway pseudopilin PulG
MAPRRTAPIRPAGGFTLVEALIALGLTVLVISAVLALFGFQRRLARVESERTEMQQAVRAAHLELADAIRRTGRGGLTQNGPSRSRPDLGVAVEVATNVEDDARLVAPAMADSPRAVAGTDVLTLRGIFEGPIYHGYDNTEDATYLVLRDAGGTVVGDPLAARRGELHLCAVSPAGFPQPVEPLRAAIAAGSEEAILLAGAAGDDDHALVKLDPASSAATSSQCNPLNPDAGVTVAFVVQGDGGRADAYHQLSGAAGGLPPSLTSVAWAGVLEEHRYYLREVREVPGDDTSPLLPRLSRARLYPNTGTGWGFDAAAREDNVALDIADDLLDFQVSLAFDSVQGGGALEDGSLAPDGDPAFESADGDADDWLFNGDDDDPASAAWARPGNAVISKPWLRAELLYVRVSTVGRAGHPAGDYRAPALDGIEDRTYDGASADDPDSPWERQFHRWLLSTTIDVRNL